MNPSPAPERKLLGGYPRPLQYERSQELHGVSGRRATRLATRAAIGDQAVGLEPISRLVRPKYPNGSTAKNYYSALKSLLVGLMDYGFIDAEPEQLLPANPFPMNGASTKSEMPLSPSEMQRLASALKADLVAIHHAPWFAGPNSEAMAVLLLLVAMRSGINTTPLIEITRDCLRPHPFMPDMMLVQTFKRRGKGAQTQSIRQTQLRDTQSAIPMDGVAVLRKALEMTDGLGSQGAGGDQRSGVALSFRAARWSDQIACLTPGTASAAIRAIVIRHGLSER